MDQPEAPIDPFSRYRLEQCQELAKQFPKSRKGDSADLPAHLRHVVFHPPNPLMLSMMSIFMSSLLIASFRKPINFRLPASNDHHLGTRCSICRVQSYAFLNHILTIISLDLSHQFLVQNVSLLTQGRRSGTPMGPEW